MIIQRFMQQVKRRPDKIAIKAGSGSLTYKELHKRSNQIANKIKSTLKYREHCIIGVLFDDAPDMIASFFGALKSGCTYVPLVTDFPVKRLEYIIRHAEISIIITNKENKERVLKTGNYKEISFVMIEDIEDTSHKLDDPRDICAGSNAYILYTSGSTGMPKGVRQTHRNILFFIDQYYETLGLTPADNLTLLASFSHDASIVDIYTALLNGASLYPLDLKKDGAFPGLLEWLRDERISVWHSVPTVYRYFAASIANKKEINLPHLRYIILGGETVLRHDIETFCNLFPGSRLYNIYGQTESTYNSGQFFSAANPDEPVTLGNVIKDTQIIVVDEEGDEVEPLEVGEIVVISKHVSPGYLNDEQSNEETFAKAPDPGDGRIYFTGDRGCRLIDGRIEFLGRKDNQIKLRGYRVELGEIENVVMQYGQIAQVAAIPLENASQEKYIACYFAANKSIELKSLRKFLDEQLPDYMIPSYFKQLEQLPVTVSGKINRKALPAPGIIPGDEHIPPGNQLEKKLAEIWSEILGVNRDIIGRDSNFFQLGGHSLKATILAETLHRDLNVKIPLAEVFKHSTIRELADYINTGRPDRDNFRSIEPVEKKEYYALSAAQKRLYFLQQMDVTGIAYNMPLVIPVRGNIETKKLYTIIKTLISRHESLRTSFIEVGDEPVQKIYEAGEVEFNMVTLSGESAAHNSQPVTDAINRIVLPFDLSKAPLLRSGIIMRPDGNRTWIVDMHHIIADGTSLMILTGYFNALFTGEELKPMKIQYKDFSQWQNRLFGSDRIKRQEEFWMNLYGRGKDIPRLDLFSDYKRPEVFTFAGENYTFKLEPEDALKFNALGAGYGATLYMNVLASLNTLFYKYTGQTDIIIGTGTAGRLHADLLHIIGMFVNTLAMRNYPEGEKTYDSFLKEVIAHSVKAFENQDVQFEELVDRLDPGRNPSRNPLFDISMVVQNFKRESSVSQNGRNPAGPKTLPVAGTHLPLTQYKNTTTKFDMTFFLLESGDDIYIKVEYYTGIFKRETIHCLAMHFKNLVNRVTRDPGVKLKDIDILSTREKEQVLYKFNDTAGDYPHDKTIHHLIAIQVEKTPDSIALVCGDEKVTYKELNDRANRMAWYLQQEKKVCPGNEDRVGILLSGSLNRPVSILATLKSGAAYVPLDPGIPGERIKYIIKDARIGTVISEKKYVGRLDRWQWECDCFCSYLCVDSYDIHQEDEQERSELMDEELWHHVGKSASDDITAGGWISSYTGQPFSREEMDEYGDNILEKLKPLLYKQMRVLEIGCASGITMYRIAPGVGLYYGTDLSAVIIHKNKRKIEKEGNQNIKLSTLQAHEIHKLDERNFDLVIMNSVVQCFNGHNYLRKVVRKSIDLLGDNGYLFIGDVMDLQKKGLLLQELVDFKYAEINRTKQYTTKTDFSSELFLCKDYWKDLGIELKEIRSIQFSDKIHTIENELTKFRYDVLITINKKPIARENKKPGNQDTMPLHLSRQPLLKRKHQDDLKTISTPGTEVLHLGVSPGNLAYIIYTSGTTGKPKGVPVTHRSLVNLCNWHNRYYNITAADNAALYANFSFDASVWELFPYLIKGASLHIIDDSVKLDIEKLEAFFDRNNISTAFLPTQFCEQFMFMEKNKNKKKKEKKNCTLRILLTGGDRLNTHNNVGIDYKLYNNYGPTENTVVTTAFPVEGHMENIPIGTPVDNTRVYILDKDNFHVQPVTVAGELCISGDGLARGYLNNPELTAAKFRRNRNNRGPTINRRERIYRTGDLALWLPDGNIRFSGRIDQQVKIRGFRVELGEIKCRLLKHPGIRNAEVTVFEDENKPGDRYLCAYIVLNSLQNREECDSTGLRRFLTRTLPEYMVPSYFILIENIPLTASGKTDLGALPAPGKKTSETYVAPRDDIERKMAAIWADVLGAGHTPIGIEDNFFDLGGHSLNATVLVSRIHKTFDVKFPLAEIFKKQTIKELSKYIIGRAVDRFVSVKPVEKKEYHPLSYAQRRLYVSQQKTMASTAYNLPQLIPLQGNPDIKKIEETMKQLIHRHESLRTSFEMKAGKPVQRIHDKVKFEIEFYDPVPFETGDAFEEKVKAGNKTTGHKTPPLESAAHIIRNFIRPFDPVNAPLLRMGLVRAGGNGGPGLLIVDMHHIITDGVSLNILKEEFFSLYRDQTLPGLPLRYKDYVRWQNSTPQLKSVQHQEKYWLERFRGDIPLLELPLDFERTTPLNLSGSQEYFSLKEQETGKLRRLAAEEKTTLFMVLLSAFIILLSKLSGQEEIIMGVGSAGRRHADLQRIIGMFVNTLALKNYPAAGKTFDRFLKEVKEQTLQAFENQDYPFEELVEKLVKKRIPNRSPLVEVVFTFQSMNKIPGAAGNNPGQSRQINHNPGKTHENEYQNVQITPAFDITLVGIEGPKELSFNFSYRNRLFKKETIRLIIENFKDILVLVARNRDISLEDIQLAHGLSAITANVIREEKNDFIF